MMSSRRDLLKLSKKELVIKCKKLKVPNNGNKSDMVDRILTKKKIKSKNKRKSKARSQRQQHDKYHGFNKSSTKICNLCIRNESVVSNDMDYELMMKLWHNRRFARLYQFTSEDLKQGEVILLRSNKIIEPQFGKQLTKLIESLESVPINNSNEDNQPSLREIIRKHQHFRQYKQLFTMEDIRQGHKNIFGDIEYSEESIDFVDELDADTMREFGFEAPENTDKKELEDDTEKMNDIKDRHMLDSLCPAIFSLKEYKFMTEINGLLCKENIALYALIENIFIKMLSMFEWLLDRKFMNDVYKQLSIIIQLEDYQLKSGQKMETKWHAEGQTYDDIIAVGLYYFDITENDSLKFDDNFIQIAAKLAWKRHCIEQVRITKNDCIVIRNDAGSRSKRYREVISTTASKKGKDGMNESISRKVLKFCLLNPDKDEISTKDPDEYKWINFPWKMNAFIKYFVGYDVEIMRKISQDLVLLLVAFTFGNEEYIANQMARFKENRVSKEDSKYGDQTFYNRILGAFNFGPDRDPIYTEPIEIGCFI